jgi:stage II sporulation protein AA (anti-sigma F factor antagonist)
MLLENYIQNKDIVVKFKGDLDDSCAEYVRNYLDKVIDDNNFLRMIFDFTNLNFMDSTGIGVLIGRYKKIKKL